MDRSEILDSAEDNAYVLDMNNREFHTEDLNADKISDKKRGIYMGTRDKLIPRGMILPGDVILRYNYRKIFYMK